MTVSAFISDDDGYSEEAYIDAIERMHPAVRFKYRPIRVLDRVQIVGELRDLNAKGKAQNAESLIAQEIANRIFSWDFLDSNGSVIDGVQSLPRSPFFASSLSFLFVLLTLSFTAMTQATSILPLTQICQAERVLRIRQKTDILPTP